MERFKFKNVIYLVFASVFLFIFTNVDSVMAYEDYTVEVEIEGLEYGDTYSSGTIVVKEQSIPGTFDFRYPDYVVNKTGTFDICVVFTPTDTITYENTYLLVEVDIKPINVVVVFDTPIYKQYDGTDSVTLPEYDYVGIIHDDVIVTGELVGRYSNTYVAENIDIILEGITLQGEHAGAYNLVLEGHTGRIHPSYMQDIGNEVIIDIDDDIYIDIGYTLKVETDSESNIINEKYTSFNKYKFVVLDHNNETLLMKGKYKVALKISEKHMLTERLTVFELDKDGKYHELNYTYTNGTLYFEMSSDSEIVFATRNIEFNLIVIFSVLLLFSLTFVVVYRVKNSKIKKEDVNEEEK